MSDPTSYAGQQESGDASSEFMTLSRLMDQAKSVMDIATIVQVMAVSNNGGLSPVGTVDIHPLVNLIDGAWQSVPHGTIYACPYFRLQGGANAVIIDPEVGDLGIAIFADRDISSVIANKAQANPGSRRRFDMADGLYLGGVLNGTPTQYVQFSSAGIKLHSPTAVILDAPDVQISCATFELAATTSASITTPNFTVNGDTQLNGSAIITGGVVAQSSVAVTGALTQGSKNVGAAHEHSGVQTGAGNTGGVV